MSPEKRIPFQIIVDEFPMFSVSDDSFTNMLEQVRKYKGMLYLAYQTTSQLSSAVPIPYKHGNLL
jgi:type IV secretory pathway TraG/TraD family ATPase VirD4